MSRLRLAFRPRLSLFGRFQRPYEAQSLNYQGLAENSKLEFHFGFKWALIDSKEAKDNVVDYL
jgi:hypothetical protein